MTVCLASTVGVKMFALLCLAAVFQFVGAENDLCSSGLCKVLHEHQSSKLLPEDICGTRNVPESDIEIGARSFGARFASDGEFPWMAAIFIRGREGHVFFTCGGSVISNRYILTAAHCVTDDERHRVTDDIRERLFVKLGERSLNGGQCSTPNCQRPAIETISTVRQFYGKGYKFDDVALIRLKHPIVFNDNIRPICLPKHMAALDISGGTMELAGWGITEHGFKNDMKAVNLTVFSQDHCKRNYEFITPKHICAGSPDNEIRRQCYGDSGGPLVGKMDFKGENRYFIFGVVSRSDKTDFTINNEPTCFMNVPGVLARVTSYMKWTMDTMYP